jgi:predicted kinase
MVGLPASGKSTRVSDMIKVNPDVFVYSTDDYIEKYAKQNGWTYDEAFAEFIEPATKHMNEMLAVAIRSKQDIIWDQTNLTVKKRRSIIDRMRRAGYAVDCECFVAPELVDDVAKWNQRLHNRPGKTIPEYIIYNMVKTYIVPTVDEGFERINYWNIHGDIQGIDYGVINNE